MLWRNWARTEWSRPPHVVEPKTTDDVGKAVSAAAKANRRIKVVGSGHSFNGIAAPTQVLLSLAALRGIIDVDKERRQAKVHAGTTLQELTRALRIWNLAMPNLGDIDQQTVAGAIATGTHGTGLNHQGLAAQVTALDMVTADGSTIRCSAEENAEMWGAVRVGLGALGIVTTVTLQLVEAFDLHAIEAPAPIDEVLENFDNLARDNDHFEFYWFPHGNKALTKRNNRVRAGDPSKPLNPIREFVDDELLSNGVFAATNMLGELIPATIPSVNRLATHLLSAREYTAPSHEVFVSPRRVRFKEMEYALPIENLRPAFAEIRRWIDTSGERISFPLEVRVAAADDIWLSTAEGRTTAYLAVHQYYRTDHRRFFTAADDILWSHAGRPHWAKLHTRTATDLRPRYPNFDRFQSVRTRLDPAGLFTNPYLSKLLDL